MGYQIRAPTATSTPRASSTTRASGSYLPTYPEDSAVRRTYDGPGNLASVADQAQNTLLYTYAANQLKTDVQVSHPNPSNNSNLYSYDAAGSRVCWFHFEWNQQTRSRSR